MAVSTLSLAARRAGAIAARIQAGRVSVCRGGRRLAKLRHSLDRPEVALTAAQWRARWRAERLFLTADGDAGKRWGNETIRVHPDEQWLEVRLPTPLAHLSNTPGRAATWRLSCEVAFAYRQAEWAAQASTGAVRYDLAFDPDRRRWYADASWKHPTRIPPSLEELRQHPCLTLDLNADHLAGWVLDPSGNPVGDPATILLELAGLPATTRDGRLRHAVAQTIRTAEAAGCHSIVVEDLDFADARQVGRERLDRGRRGKRFRRTVHGIPTRTRAFRDLLVGMAANAGLWIIAVDPAYTSRWGGQHWQAPLNNETKKLVTVSRHHAAAVVIGRRGLGFDARRRPGVTQPHQRMGTGELPARPSDQTLSREGPGPPGGQRQRHGHIAWHDRGRPVWLSGSGLGTRWHTTVWCHPSVLPMTLTDADESGTVARADPRATADDLAVAADDPGAVGDGAVGRGHAGDRSDLGDDAGGDRRAADRLAAAGTAAAGDRPDDHVGRCVGGIAGCRFERTLRPEGAGVVGRAIWVSPASLG